MYSTNPERNQKTTQNRIYCNNNFFWNFWYLGRGLHSSLTQLIGVDDQVLKNPSEKFLNELTSICKGPSSTEIELPDVENLGIAHTASLKMLNKV